MRGSAVLALLVLAATAARADQPATVTAASVAAVHEAIVRAVVERLGPRTLPSITHLDLRVDGEVTASTLVATPDPTARLGRVVRFRLRWHSAGGRVQSGEAQCLLDAAVPHARATRFVPRGVVVDSDAVAEVLSSPGPVVLRRLPVDLDGARALVDLLPGQPILPASVARPPVVHSGDDVVVVLRAPGFAVAARGVATENGDLGERVRVINPSSGRRVTGRVVARGQIEVNHGS